MPEVTAKLEMSIMHRTYALLLASESGKTFIIDFSPEIWSKPFYGRRISEDEIKDLMKFLEMALWEGDDDEEDTLE